MDPLGVIDGLTMIFTKFGAPTLMVMDRGGEFYNRVCHNFFRLWGVKVHYPLAYNPQANGQAEAAVKIVTRKLNLALQEAQRNPSAHTRANDWPFLLPYVTMSYNISPSPITGYSPHELMFGRMYTLPAIQAVLSSEALKSADQNSYLLRLQHALRESIRFTQEKAKKRREYLQRLYNKHRSLLRVQEGDYVLILHPYNHKTKKLEGKTTGPWLVRKVTCLPHTLEVVYVTVEVGTDQQGVTLCKSYPRNRILPIRKDSPTKDWESLRQEVKTLLGYSDDGQVPTTDWTRHIYSHQIENTLTPLPSHHPLEEEESSNSPWSFESFPMTE
jgi:hypothetical protein